MPVQRTHSNTDQHLLVNKSQYGLKMNFLKTFSILWSGAGGIRAQRNTIIRHQSRWSDSRKLFGFSHTRKKYLFVDLCSFVRKLHSVFWLKIKGVASKFSSGKGSVPSKMPETPRRPTQSHHLWWQCQSCLRSYQTWFGSEWVDSLWRWQQRGYKMMLTQDLPLPGSIFSVKNPPSRCLVLHCIRIRDNRCIFA